MAYNPSFYNTDRMVGSSNAPDADAASALNSFQLEAFQKHAIESSYTSAPLPQGSAEKKPAAKTEAKPAVKPVSEQPSTNYVDQAAEQNRIPKPGTTNFIEQAQAQNPYLKPLGSNLIDQAREQNPYFRPPGNNLIERDQKPRSRNLIGQSSGSTEIKKVETPRINPMESYSGLHEFFKDDVKQVPGLHKFFRDDLEKNLIENVASTIGAANVLSDFNREGKNTNLLRGTIGELFKPNPSDYWHSSNETGQMSDYINKGAKAYGYDPLSVATAIDTMKAQIDANIKFEKSGNKMDAEQRERLRQMAENTALLQLGMAQELQAAKPAEAKALVSGKGYSVKELVQIAQNYGSNPKNLAQITERSEKLEK